jgi:hypothetical protein
MAISKELIEEIAELLPPFREDGITVGEIHKKLAGRVSERAVRYAIRDLYQSGRAHKQGAVRCHRLYVRRPDHDRGYPFA